MLNDAWWPMLGRWCHDWPIARLLLKWTTATTPARSPARTRLHSHAALLGEI